MKNKVNIIPNVLISVPADGFKVDLVQHFFFILFNVMSGTNFSSNLKSYPRPKTITKSQRKKKRSGVVSVRYLLVMFRARRLGIVVYTS